MIWLPAVWVDLAVWIQPHTVNHRLKRALYKPCVPYVQHTECTYFNVHAQSIHKKSKILCSANYSVNAFINSFRMNTA